MVAQNRPNNRPKYINKISYTPDACFMQLLIPISKSELNLLVYTCVTTSIKQNFQIHVVCKASNVILRLPFCCKFIM